jgi:hypothetical protein
METIDLVRREIRALLDAYEAFLEAAASQQEFNLAELRHISGQCAGSLLLIAGVQHVPPWLVLRTELETALRDLAEKREYTNSREATTRAGWPGRSSTRCGSCWSR